MEDIVCVTKGNDMERFELKRNANVLGLVIVLQAIKDWQSYTKELEHCSKRRATFLKKGIASCEEFFRSPRCESYCGISGQYIREHINEYNVPEFDSIIRGGQDL